MNTSMYSLAYFIDFSNQFVQKHHNIVVCYQLLMSVCVSVVCLYICGCVRFQHWALSHQGQGHGVKFFSVCHNTNWQILYLSFGTC